MSIETHPAQEVAQIVYAHDLNGAQRFVEEDSEYKEPTIRTVVVVDKRILFSECLLASLKKPLPDMHFVRCTSIAELSIFYRKNSNMLVILCLLGDETGEVNFFDNEIVEELRKMEPTINFAILSDQEKPADILNALSKGARGYIQMSLPLEIVTQALRLICAGGVFIPASSLMSLAVSEVARPEPVKQETDLLSPRQILVAKALRKGTPNKIIAYQLNMCESTVKVHVRHIMKKLKAKNRTEVAFLTNQMFQESP